MGISGRTSTLCIDALFFGFSDINVLFMNEITMSIFIALKCEIRLFKPDNCTKHVLIQLNYSINSVACTNDLLHSKRQIATLSIDKEVPGFCLS